MNYKGIDIQRPKEKSSLEVTQEQTRLFERLQNQPFWIWNIEEHKRDDIMTNGECCRLTRYLFAAERWCRQTSL